MVASPVSAVINQRDVARVKKRMARYQGAPLRTRLQKGTLAAAQLLRGPVAALAPVKSGRLKKSTRARTVTPRGGVPGLAAIVGPTARHRLLVIRGHRIVTPGGRYLGRSTRPNDYVDRAARANRRRAIETVRREIFRV